MRHSLARLPEISKLSFSTAKPWPKKYDPVVLRSSIETGWWYRSAHQMRLHGGYELDITFPSPQDININMMPFIMSEKFENTKLPQYLREYYQNIISACHYSYDRTEGKIYFLTIQESFVKQGESQRRPGLHIDCAPDKSMLSERSIFYNKGAGKCQ